MVRINCNIYAATIGRKLTMWYRLWTLFIKEWHALMRSRQTRQLLIIPILIQVAVFPFATTLEVKNSSLAIYNEDIGQPSIELIQRLSAASAFTKIIMIYNEQQLKKVINEQEALFTIRIPPDFSKNINSHQPAVIQAILDGRRSNSAQIALKYAQQIIAQYVEEKSNAESLTDIRIRHLYNPNLEYKWFVLPSLVALITTIGCLMLTALSLAREKEEGTFDQLLVTPLTPAYIMAGKSVPAIMVALVQGMIISAAALWIYGLPFTGSVGCLFVSMICYGLSLVGFGFVISAICNTQQQAFMGAFGFIVIAVILSGYLAPVENMPFFLRMVSQINPLMHFMEISSGLFLKSYGFSESWPHIWPLIAISIVMIVFSYFMFKLKSTH